MFKSKFEWKACVTSVPFTSWLTTTWPTPAAQKIPNLESPISDRETVVSLLGKTQRQNKCSYIPKEFIIERTLDQLRLCVELTSLRLHSARVWKLLPSHVYAEEERGFGGTSWFSSYKKSRGLTNASSWPHQRQKPVQKPPIDCYNGEAVSVALRQMNLLLSRTQVSTLLSQVCRKQLFAKILINNNLSTG